MRFLVLDGDHCGKSAMWSKIAGKHGFVEDFRKTIHPAGAMCTGKRQTHIRNAPSSRTAVTGIALTTGACRFALHIDKNILPSRRFGTRAYLLRGATQIRRLFSASLLRRETGCAAPAISARCALYACSADVLPGATARAFQRDGPLSGQAGNRYCFRVVAKIEVIGSFSCSSSSYANPDRRAAGRGSAFLPRPDSSRMGRWTSHTGGACA